MDVVICNVAFCDVMGYWDALLGFLAGVDGLILGKTIELLSKNKIKKIYLSTKLWACGWLSRGGNGPACWFFAG